jgi:hypothetical protein
MLYPVFDPEISLFLQKELFSHKIALSLINSIPKNLLHIAHSIEEISSRWNPIEIITPTDTSIVTEKSNFIEAFRKGEIYHPRFSYDLAITLAATMQQQKSRDELQRLLYTVKQTEPHTPEERIMRVALYSKIKDDIATVDLTEGIASGNEEMIAGAFERKYGKVHDQLVAQAVAIYDEIFVSGDHDSETNTNPYLNCEEQQFLKGQEFDAEGLKDLFEWSLQKLGITEFEVVISDKATSIDVLDKSENGPTIFIPTSRKVKGDKALELVEHEIRGHVRQSVNGYRMFRVGGGNLKFDNDTLYEGLAKRYDEAYRKDFFAENTGVPIPYFTFAVAKAETGGSFYEIFAEQFDLRLRAAIKVPLEDSLPPHDQIDPNKISKAMDSAWSTAYRVMRGHTDTSNKQGYAMAKDLSYLQGWLMDRELREHGYGIINESAVVAPGGLLMLANYQIHEADLPIKDHYLAQEYWQEVLKPKMQSQQT